MLSGVCLVRHSPPSIDLKGNFLLGPLICLWCDCLYQCPRFVWSLSWNIKGHVVSVSFQSEVAQPSCSLHKKLGSLITAVLERPPSFLLFLDFLWGSSNFISSDEFSFSHSVTYCFSSVVWHRICSLSSIVIFITLAWLTLRSYHFSCYLAFIFINSVLKLYFYSPLCPVGGLPSILYIL